MKIYINYENSFALAEPPKVKNSFYSQAFFGYYYHACLTIILDLLNKVMNRRVQNDLESK